MQYVLNICIYIFRHYLQVSETHTLWGEVFGVAAWLWIFHRARHDLPVVLGWRHAWEHGGDDDHGHDSHGDGDHLMQAQHEKWDKFSNKAMQQLETDDDDDEEDEEEEEDDEEE
jgi:hypothetical protein